MENGGNAGFLAGVPELVILKLLQDREMYGYEIVRTVARATQDVVASGEGLVYPLLHALEKEGAVRLWRDWACCVMRGGNELVACGNWLHVRS